MPEARLAQGADLGLVQAITDAAYAEHVGPLGGVPLPMTAEYAPMIAAGQVWLVSREGLDVGLCVLERDVEALVIVSLAVLPGARGGVGRWMLAFAEARARAAGLGVLRLYTNERMARNIRIYAEAGFVETGRREVRPGWMLVDMAKRLSPTRSGVVVVDGDVGGGGA